MKKVTIGEYLSYITKALEYDPSIINDPLYSDNGILFGFEDHEDTARRFGCSEFDVRVMINSDRLEGIRSNDHIIVPKFSEKPIDPPLPIFIEEDDYEPERHSGLISDEL